MEQSRSLTRVPEDRLLDSRRQGLNGYDLIAITRLLYAKDQAADGHPLKLQQIADIGRSLKIALDMTKCSPGSMGQGVAWSRAAAALDELGVLLKEQQVQPLLDTVGRRMSKIRRG